MNTTIQTWSFKLKSDDFQSYPKRNIAAKDEKGVDDVRKYMHFVNCSFSSFKNKICVLIKLLRTNNVLICLFILCCH